MSTEAIARRYAKAVFEIGVETNQLDGITSQFEQLAEIYETSDDLRAAMDSPLVTESQREQVLAGIAKRIGANKTVTNTLTLLVRRHRMQTLPALAKTLQQLSDEKAGVVRGTVTSPKQLSNDFVRKLQNTLEKRLGKRVLLTQQTDPGLIAGLVTHIGDLVMDGSLRTRLNTLRSQLLAE